MSYRFLDAGNGRKLEEFQNTITNRPAPAADFAPKLNTKEWEKATLKYDHETGWKGCVPQEWIINIHSIVMRLNPMKSGQVGLFPEHLFHADFIKSRSSKAAVLNLFAHTGLLSILLAKYDAAVTHLDAMKSAVDDAKTNAKLNQINSIRWIVDDAAMFVKREIKRNKKYDAVILDPPAFGRANKNEWKLDRDLPKLIDGIAELLSKNACYVLLTCHPTHGELDAYKQLLANKLPHGKISAGFTPFISESKQQLPVGLFVRWQRE